MTTVRKCFAEAIAVLARTIHWRSGGWRLYRWLSEEPSAVVSQLMV
jgi:hypothetical protein